MYAQMPTYDATIVFCEKSIHNFNAWKKKARETRALVYHYNNNWLKNWTFARLR
jgi:hypothetical protein